MKIYSMFERHSRLMGLYLALFAVVGISCSVFFNSTWIILSCILIALLWVGWHVQALSFYVGLNLTVIRRTIVSLEDDAGPLEMRVVIVRNPIDAE